MLEKNSLHSLSLFFTQTHTHTPCSYLSENTVNALTAVLNSGAGLKCMIITSATQLNRGDPITPACTAQSLCSNTAYLQLAWSHEDYTYSVILVKNMLQHGSEVNHSEFSILISQKVRLNFLQGHSSDNGAKCLAKFILMHLIMVKRA